MSRSYEPRRGQGATDGAAPPRLRRAVAGAWVAGVCQGLATHLGVDVRWVRAIFALTTIFFSGLGLVVYLALWAMTPQDLDPDEAAAPAGSGSVTVGKVRSALGDESAMTIGAGVVLLVGGAVLLLGGGVAQLGVVLPLVLVAVGAVITWAQLDRSQRLRWAGGDPRSRDGLWRVLVGAGLAVTGLLVLGARANGPNALADSAFSALLVLAGVVVIAAPWALRGWDDLRREQAERIRATERADIAAHLHDSVLQTLALIQRKADDPAQVARLARAQERELRTWLYGGGAAVDATLASEVKSVVDTLEDLHGVPVDLVVTGDAPYGPDADAFARALGEAVSNAVRHGAPPVSVYVEIGRGQVEAFVRDHGAGFDLESIPADRAGVRRSVIDRLARRGGRATFRRLDEGTEVALQLPLDANQPSPTTEEQP